MVVINYAEKDYEEVLSTLLLNLAIPFEMYRYSNFRYHIDIEPNYLLKLSSLYSIRSKMVILVNNFDYMVYDWQQLPCVKKYI